MIVRLPITAKSVRRSGEPPRRAGRIFGAHGMGPGRRPGVMSQRGVGGMEERAGRGRLGRRSPRSLRPELQAMESRELLSVTAALAQQSAAVAPSAILASALSEYPTPPLRTPIVLPTADSQSPLIGVGPTRRELARERFKAAFAGPVYVSGGRFSDQAKVIYYRGLGTSNTFLHGDYQMGIVFPTDPNAPLYGEAVMQDKNPSSAGILSLQLTGGPPQSFDRLGRPTTFPFRQDGTANAGIFAANT